MLKNMKIGKRLIVAFIIAIVVASIAGVIGIILLNQSDRDYSDALDNYGFAQGELGNLSSAFESSRATNMFIITAADTASRAEFEATLVKTDKLIDEYMLQVKARLASELGQQTYATLAEQLQVFRTVRDATLAKTASMKDLSAAVALYRDEASEAYQAASTTIGTMLADKTRIGTEKSAQLTSQAALFSAVMIIAMVAGAVIAMILAVMISRGISKPMSEIEAAAIKMSEGNFDVDITFASRDEVGSLAQSMRTMITVISSILNDAVRALSEIADGNFDLKPQVEFIGIFKGIEAAIGKITNDMSDTLSQIKVASEQVASGSDQVSSGSQALAQGATEQASSVEELSASINEVSEQIKGNANNALSASTLADKVGLDIETSNKQMSQMVSAMSEISSSSAEISKIIKTIEDIAFQTNILALNAAVEAARAGAAGKGFAVVADEVRNLATKSSEAAKQTNALIEGSVKSVGNGVKIAEDTAKSLQEVVIGAGQITDLISKISSASGEQASSISQITLGVEQISSVVQTNSATSEESAAASEELNGQANMMRQLVTRFRLLNSPVPTSKPAKSAASKKDEIFEEFASGDKY